MSTLFILGAAEVSEKQYFLLEKESSSLFQNRDCFDRILNVSSFNELFLQLYNDRTITLPNLYNYERGVSLILYDPDYCDLLKGDKEKNRNQVPVRQVNDFLNKFFPVLNIIALDYRDEKMLDNFFKNLRQEIIISQDRILRLNHWMYHQNEEDIMIDNSTNDEKSFPGCDTNIYSMLKHLSNSEKLLASTISNDNEENLFANSINDNITFINMLLDPNITKNGNFDEIRYLDLLSTWNFNALELTTKELIICGFVLIRKLIKDTNATELQLSDNHLLFLLFTIESSYHQVNKFHNFRHAIDVMQSTWQLCVNLKLTNKVHILLLTMAAIGHDIGHPGTNNQLFKKFNCLLGIKFNNVSVLERFHKQVFQNLIWNQWSNLMKASVNNMNLINEAILATDMAFHSTYVAKLDEIICHRKNILENPGKQDSLKDVEFGSLISFIIKAADISNVTRSLIVSAKWAFLITLEFKDSCSLEKYHEDYEISTQTLCDDAVKDKLEIKYSDVNYVEKIFNILNSKCITTDDLTKKYPAIPGGQIFFINTFAEEFFTKLAKVFPELQFLSDNVQSNKKFWLNKLNSEN
ncbi:3',5'-cyclic-nucleotide phosphodiesterase PDE2 NDAI_0A08750 [Naumovozyma dairenensis CBS 421]|uniref:Phosphodiesterase n=1 Tax=Naumovozyma dairenensis (strain ATCC 10597 / BCRC 20456 / CBS 421 / NBRC 0211 / NRRL Y-12639) TaxID=1071378 RepID=G0W5E0_NAUDC|nr:hypothetical protein NDAI_0A08750 [Naumovozyma dairenensis CBS 421]CCD23028.1 hypothetical protein NDAI_0A08750 [Naumovozyma dairenensis CBS 421]